MSASKRQIKSNRQNAQKSTGPKTNNGKAVVSKNAVKHGFYSNDIIINSSKLQEDPEEYKNLLADLNDELRPFSEFQVFLVRRIANCLWRSQRALLAETAQINRQLESVDSNLDFEALANQLLNIEQTDEDTVRATANLIGTKAIPNDASSLNILRYEMRLDRQMTRAFKLLKILQMDAARNQHRSYIDEQKNDETNPICY